MAHHAGREDDGSRKLAYHALEPLVVTVWRNIDSEELCFKRCSLTLRESEISW
jgi:hypothetical protein